MHLIGPKQFSAMVAEESLVAIGEKYVTLGTPKRFVIVITY